MPQAVPGNLRRPFPRRCLSDYYLRRLNRNPDLRGPHAAAEPALVLAPHQDDETLACGGTIIKKRRAGATVRIAFMTDGRNSHRRLIDPDKLATLRRDEALAAAAKLGVPENDVTFLGIEDGSLAGHGETAIAQVAELLREFRPLQVYVPYRREPPEDHRATFRIAEAALRHSGLTTTLYEYPVWYWHHWPWVAPSPRRRRESLAIASNTVSAAAGLRLLLEFRQRNYIGDVIALKRAALDEHRSQMSPLLEDPCWKTLADVCCGEWLDCFFGEVELFRTRQIRPD